MWEIDISREVWGLLFSLLLGIAASLFYDLFRAIHKTFKCATYIVFLTDILYWIILTLCFFIYFMVFTNGQVRLYSFMGSLAGFIFSRLTLSKIWVIIIEKILLLLRFLICKLGAVLSLFSGIFIKFCIISKKSLKKAFLKRKKA